MKRKYITLSLAAALAALPQAFAAPAPPLVNRALFTISSGNPVELTIVGSNFGTVKPTVMIEGIPQTVANGNSDTFAKINNPNLSLPHAGMYRVTITNNSTNGPVADRTTEFYVELDIDAPPVPGPQGPAGPQGPQGPAGPQGLPGGAAQGFGQNVGNAKPSNGAQCTVGQAILSAGSLANGLLANGQLLPIQPHTALFSVIGTLYGGDGITNFALPDLRPVTPNGLTYTICDLGVFPSPR